MSRFIAFEVARRQLTPAAALAEHLRAAGHEVVTTRATAGRRSGILLLADGSMRPTDSLVTTRLKRGP
ncbi:MAG: hypothetical protein V9E82_03955 [Candidatus Nanopelagicales bacterium]